MKFLQKADKALQQKKLFSNSNTPLKLLLAGRVHQNVVAVYSQRMQILAYGVSVGD